MTSIVKFFLPHHKNNHRAHAVKAPAIFSYVVFLILLQVFLKIFSIPGSNILGVSTNISATDIISLTNERRISQGVRPVKENQLLSQAAAAKAQDMLNQNYWAHFAPDGKTPWQFITQTGYKYSVAGENLARDFDNANSVVVAWMNSPSHKQNLLDGSFTEIGVAVTEGNLNGVNGSLVVQMFASPANPAPAQQAETPTPAQTTNSQPATSSATIVGTTNSDTSETGGTPLSTEAVQGEASQVQVNYPLNPYLIIKTVSLIISSLLVLLIAVDIIYVRRNRINRALHHNFAHLFVFSLFAIAITFISSGSIL